MPAHTKPDPERVHITSASTLWPQSTSAVLQQQPKRTMLAQLQACCHAFGTAQTNKVGRAQATYEVAMCGQRSGLGSPSCPWPLQQRAHCLQQAHLYKLAELLGGTRLALRCCISTSGIISASSVRLAAAVLLLMVFLPVLFVPLLLLLLLPTIPLPLAAALILLKAVYRDAPRGGSRCSLQGSKLSSSCSSLHGHRQTWRTDVRRRQCL